MGTLARHDATSRVLVYVEAPPAHSADREMATSHLATCPPCQDKVRFLLRALMVDEEDELICETCLSELPAFVLAQVLDEDRKNQVVITRHLAGCPSCAATHGELLTITELAYASEPVEPPFYPAPDLSFLSRQRSGAPADMLDQLIIAFRQGLLLALNPPAAQPAWAMQRRPGDKKEIGSLAVGGAKSVRVEITAYEEAGDPTRCQVIVAVRIPRRSWSDLAGLKVVMKAEGEVLCTAETDAFGVACFEGVPLAILDQVALQIKEG